MGSHIIKQEEQARKKKDRRGGVNDYINEHGTTRERRKSGLQAGESRWT